MRMRAARLLGRAVSGACERGDTVRLLYTYLGLQNPKHKAAWGRRACLGARYQAPASVGMRFSCFRKWLGARLVMRSLGFCAKDHS